MRDPCVIKGGDGLYHMVWTVSWTEKGIAYASSKDFKSFKKTKLLYEPGFNGIDASIVKDENGYTMFLKDETKVPVQKNVKMATSKNSEGPYTKASEPITGNYWAEGPTATQINGEWIIYFDKYTQKKYGAIKQTVKGWEDISEQISFPKGTRHGTVIKVSADVVAALKRNNSLPAKPIGNSMA
jgi:hypothetical protein